MSHYLLRDFCLRKCKIKFFFCPRPVSFQNFIRKNGRYQVKFLVRSKNGSSHKGVVLLSLSKHITREHGDVSNNILKLVNV